MDDANVVIAALRKKFPSIANPPKDDICYATQNRQEAVRELAAQADLVLVLGSQNSSNSQRLAEIAHSLGITVAPDRRRRRDPGRLVRGRRDRADHRRGVAPEDVVQECIEYLDAELRRDDPEEAASGKKTSTSPSPSRSASCCPASSSPRQTEAVGHRVV